MKMSNKKFVAIATTLGLGVGLLTGCAPTSNYDDDDDDKKRGTSGSGAVIVPPAAKSPSSSSIDGGAIGGSKGIGGAKAGGAGS